MWSRPGWAHPGSGPASGRSKSIGLSVFVCAMGKRGPWAGKESQEEAPERAGTSLPPTHTEKVGTIPQSPEDHPRCPRVSKGHYVQARADNRGMTPGHSGERRPSEIPQAGVPNHYYWWQVSWGQSRGPSDQRLGALRWRHIVCLGCFREQRGLRRQDGTGGRPSPPLQGAHGICSVKYPGATCAPGLSRESRGVLKPTCEVREVSEAATLPHAFAWLPPQTQPRRALAQAFLSRFI